MNGVIEYGDDQPGMPQSGMSQSLVLPNNMAAAYQNVNAADMTRGNTALSRQTQFNSSVSQYLPDPTDTFSSYLYPTDSNWHPLLNATEEELGSSWYQYVYSAGNQQLAESNKQKIGTILQDAVIKKGCSSAIWAFLIVTFIILLAGIRDIKFIAIGAAIPILILITAFIRSSFTATDTWLNLCRIFESMAQDASGALTSSAVTERARSYAMSNGTYAPMQQQYNNNGAGGSFASSFAGSVVGSMLRPTGRGLF
jgi:hypothetical protein